MSGPVTDESGDGDGEMTLAFTLSAIERFESPAEVFADARTWSRHVGIVANDTDAVERFVADHGLRQDFELGERDKWLAAEEIREATDTPRHVFVGTTVEDRRVADHTGWEYRRVQEAADAAGWDLAADETANTPPAERLVARLKGTLWPF